LSPRVLYFGQKELFWECCECTTCECRNSNNNFGISKDSFTNVITSGTEDELQSTWRQIVEAHSSTRLTIQSDKLPALAGIAKQFLKRRPTSTYIAGLWSSSLLEDMLWYVPWQWHDTVHSNILQTAIPMQWRAPSWSWASLNCKILYPSVDDFWTSYTTRASYSKIEHLEYLPMGDDVTGEAKMAQVTICGPMIQVDSCPRPRLAEDR
jgi:hypothetical protein